MNPPPSKQDGQVGVPMQIAVADAAAIEDQRMVQQGTIAVRRRSQPIQKIREMLGLVDVDPDYLVDLVLFVFVVRQRVVTVGNADLVVGSCAELAARHERGHTSQVGLVGEHLQVVHQLRVLVEPGRHIRRTFDRRQFPGGLFLGLLDAPLHIANGVEILGELGAVGWTESAS